MAQGKEVSVEEPVLECALKNREGLANKIGEDTLDKRNINLKSLQILQCFILVRTPKKPQFISCISNMEPRFENEALLQLASLSLPSYWLYLINFLKME